MRNLGDQELSKRSLVGVLTYFLGWVFVASSTDIRHIQPIFVYGVGLVLLIFGLLRLLMVKKFDHWHQKNPEQWRRWFALGVISSSGLWSLLCAWGLSHVGLTVQGLIILIPVIMICAGGVVSLAPNRRLAYTFSSTLLLPQIAVLLCSGGHNAYLIVLMLFFFGIFILVTSKNINRSYWQVLYKNELLDHHYRQLAKAKDIA